MASLAIFFFHSFTDHITTLCTKKSKQPFISKVLGQASIRKDHDYVKQKSILNLTLLLKEMLSPCSHLQCKNLSRLQSILHSRDTITLLYTLQI